MSTIQLARNLKIWGWTVQRLDFVVLKWQLSGWMKSRYFNFATFCTYLIWWHVSRNTLYSSGALISRVAKSVQIGKHCTALHYTSNTTLHGLFLVYKFSNFRPKIRLKNGWITSFLRKFLILKFRPDNNGLTDFILITNITWNWFRRRKFSRKILEHQESCNSVYFPV